MRVRGVSITLGAVFGFVISWAQFTDPDRIRDMLLLRDPYLYLMMATAVAIGMLGLRLLERRRARALVTGEQVTVERSRPERRHLVGAAIFGVGWATADSCPAPIAAQLTQGVFWALFTITGIFLGIELFFRRRERLARAEAETVSERPEPLPARAALDG